MIEPVEGFHSFLSPLNILFKYHWANILGWLLSVNKQSVNI